MRTSYYRCATRCGRSISVVGVISLALVLLMLIFCFAGCSALNDLFKKGESQVIESEPPQLEEAVVAHRLPDGIINTNSISSINDWHVVYSDASNGQDLDIDVYRAVRNGFNYVAAQTLQSIDADALLLNYIADDCATVYTLREIAELTKIDPNDMYPQLTPLGNELGYSDNDIIKIDEKLPKNDQWEGFELPNNKKNTLITYNDQEILIVKDSKTRLLYYVTDLLGIATRSYFETARYDAFENSEFISAFETARAEGAASFTANDEEYTIESIIEPFIEPVDRSDTEFYSTIAKNGFQHAIEEAISKASIDEETSFKAGGSDYLFKWYAFRAVAFTGKAGDPEKEAIVNANEFQSAAYACYNENREAMLIWDENVAYPKFDFSTSVADYTMEYSSEAGYFTIKEKGKDVIYAKLSFNEGEIYKVSIWGEELYAKFSKYWILSTIQLNGEDIEYVYSYADNNSII